MGALKEELLNNIPYDEDYEKDSFEFLTDQEHYDTVQPEKF